ncbi:iron-containing alcohol dehydrogenase [Vibrio parahaemolyticus]
MLNFIFKNQTEIIFGQGQLKELSNRIPKNGKVLFVYGGGSIKLNGVYEDVIRTLEGVDIIEFSGIEPNPTYETLEKAVTLAKKQNISFVLAVGGGSVIDGAKYIAAAALYEGDGWDILVNGHEVKRALPVGVVLTLPATGSESNGNSVITRKETRQKRSFRSPIVQPKFAVLDPTYTFSLPKQQIANGVVDAFVHVIEQYLTYPVNSPLQDRFSEGILLTLLEEGPKALEHTHNYDVRANVMWAATMALNGLIGQGVPQDWSTHMIGHELTALYNLDHAASLAVVLPSLMYVQQEQKRDKIAQLGERVFGLTSLDKNALIDATIKHTQDFFEHMGIHTKLGDYGLGQEAIQAIIDNLQLNGMLAIGEHRDIDKKVVEKILNLAL